MLCLGVKYFPKIDHSNFIMKVNGRKFFHLNLEFKKSDYQTFERQQIYSLVNKYCLVWYVPGTWFGEEYTKMNKNSVFYSQLYW